MPAAHSPDKLLDRKVRVCGRALASGDWSGIFLVQTHGLLRGKLRPITVESRCVGAATNHQGNADA